MSHGPSGTRRTASLAWLLAALGLFALSGLGQIRHLRHWLDLGGRPWTQGDWLINSAGGPVRRGPFGSALLALAGAAGVPVMTLLGALQGLLVVALYGLTGVLVWRAWRVQRETVLLAVLSAAFFAFVYGASPSSGLRKEIIGLVALLLVALPGGGLGRVGLSASLAATCAAGHEVGVLLLPAWLVALHLLRPEMLAANAGRVLAGATVLAVIWAAVHTLRHPTAPRIDAMCAAIRAGGPVAPDICDGAIAWLARGDSGAAQVAGALRARGGRLAVTLPSMAAAVVPVVRLLALCGAPRASVLAIAAAVLPLSLLYPVGFDWGRWLSIQVSVAAILTLGLILRGGLRVRRPAGSAELASWMGLAVATGLNLSLDTLPFSFLLVAHTTVTGAF